MSSSDVAIKKQLSKYKSNPLRPLELERIQGAFRQNDSSVESFKQIYRRDPVFCYALIGEATKATRKRISSPFAADHALSTIGIKSAEKLFKNMQPNHPELSMEVHFSLTTSLLAAQIANNIGQLYGGNRQAYWTALCYLLPDTMLWHICPKEMWTIYYQQLTDPHHANLYEVKRLGFSLFEWRIAVAKMLNLSDQNKILFEKKLPANPKEILLYANHGFSDKTPTLKEWHRHEGWLIVMANRLARAILIPWNNSSFRQNFKAISQLAGSDSKKLSEIINQAIRQVSIDLNLSNLPIPAVSYLMTKSHPVFPEWLVKPKQASATQAKRKPAVVIDAAKQKVLRQRLAKNASRLKENIDSTFQSQQLNKTEDEVIGKIKSTKQRTPIKNQTVKPPTQKQSLPKKEDISPQKSEPTQPATTQVETDGENKARIKPDLKKGTDVVLSDSNQTQSNKSNVQQEKSNTASKNRNINFDIPVAKVKAAFEQLVTQSKSFDSSVAIIQFAMQFLINELKFDRVAFLSVDYSSSSVTTKIVLNQPEQKKIRPDFDFKTPTPLSKFIERQAFMLLTRKTHKNIWQKMPEAIQKQQVEQFILFSLKPGKRVRALFYIDSSELAAFSPKRLEVCKKLLLALSKSLAIKNRQQVEQNKAVSSQGRS